MEINPIKLFRRLTRALLSCGQLTMPQTAVNCVLQTVILCI